LSSKIIKAALEETLDGVNPPRLSICRVSRL
jgi:hypothetical protein